jgi:hypothetical protein
MITTTHENKFGANIRKCADNDSAVIVLNAADHALRQYSSSLTERADTQAQFDKATNPIIKKALANMLSEMQGSDDTARIKGHESACRIGGAVIDYIERTFKDPKVWASLTEVELSKKNAEITKLFKDFPLAFPIKK